MLFANVFSFSIFSWRLELLIWNYLEKDYEQQNHKTKCKNATKMDKNDVWNLQKKNENKVRNQHGRVLTHSIHTFVWNASAINLSIWITDTPKLQSGEVRAQNALVWFCYRRTKDSFFSKAVSPSLSLLQPKTIGSVWRPVCIKRNSRKKKAHRANLHARTDRKRSSNDPKCINHTDG